MPSNNAPTADKIATLCAQAVDAKKADDIVILDLRKISTFADFFVICSGTSEPHLKAIVGELQDSLKKDHGIRPLRVDGFPLSHWVVADFGDVVVHIFNEEKRRHFALEDLWSDAPRLPFAPVVPEPVAK